MFAHTDETPAREVVEFDDDIDNWSVSSISPTSKELDIVIELAQTHLRTFLVELERLNAELAMLA